MSIEYVVTYEYSSPMYDILIGMVFEYCSDTTKQYSMADLFNKHVMSKYNGKLDFDEYNSIAMYFGDKNDFLMFCLSEIDCMGA